MICFVTSSLPCHSSAALSGNLVANLFFSIGTHLFWNLHFHYLTLFFGNFITFMVMDNFTDLMWNLITNSLRNLKLWYNLFSINLNSTNLCTLLCWYWCTHWRMNLCHCWWDWSWVICVMGRNRSRMVFR